MISCATIMVSTAWRNASASKWPAGERNFIRFSDDRLQAESSRNMYSEQGLLALMRPVFLRGVPAVDGGVELHAGIAALVGGLGDLAHQLAGAVGLGRPCRWLPRAWTTRRSSSTACMNSSVTRTLLLAFWKKMEL